MAGVEPGVLTYRYKVSWFVDNSSKCYLPSWGRHILFSDGDTHHKLCLSYASCLECWQDHSGFENGREVPEESQKTHSIQRDLNRWNFEMNPAVDKYILFAACMTICPPYDYLELAGAPKRLLNVRAGAKTR